MDQYLKHFLSIRRFNDEVYATAEMHIKVTNQLILVALIVIAIILVIK